MGRLQQIAANDRSVYFISPHLDDAMLSSGGLIHYLKNHGKKITVITVFTKPSSPPESMHARKLVRQCGYDSARELFRQRKMEDEVVFQRLGIKTIHLDFTDAAWRKKQNIQYGWLGRLVPELIHLYPLRSFKYTKKVHRQDGQLIEQIEKTLQSLIPDPQADIFCPLARGNHVDHIITNIACTRVFIKPIYWSDFPYSLREKNKVAGYTRVKWDKCLDRKIESVIGYRTQMRMLFGRTPPPVCPEEYYLNNTGNRLS